jgi:hypothetical protein
MRHLIQRIGFRITRGWAVLLLMAGGLMAGALWVGPLRPLPPELRLVALGADGRFRETVDIPASWADSTHRQPGVPARFPIVLAVYNNGARTAVPVRLTLSVPHRFRLASSNGQAYPGKAAIGNPLVQYAFDIAPGHVVPRQLPRVLSSLDTLWLEPVLPGYYCTLLDSVPEFVPAPPQDPNALARVRVFYSFEAGTRARQAGVLSLHIEPRLLVHTPPPVPPIFPTRTREPEFPSPAAGPLRQVGSRSTQCGDAGSNVALNSVLWETPEGGRFFVVHHGTRPRKYLFDLNRDSIIEFEMWDPDRDGKFEAARAARMLIPEFLMPARAVLATLDSVTPDSMVVAAAASDTAARAMPVPELDFEFPATLFRDTASGPFRFWRALQSARAAAPQPETARVVPARPAPPPERRAPVTPPTDTGPRLLGRPIPGATPPVRRDTVRRDTIRRDTIRRDTLRGYH